MWEDTTPDDTDADYWRGDFNNRGAESRVLFDPTASDMRPAFANVIGGENIITSGLILNLDGNNYTSGSTWNDSSGEGHHGTINGATYNSGNGGYFDFDGANDYININDTGVLPSGTNSFTYSIWVYIDTVSGFGVELKELQIYLLEILMLQQNLTYLPALMTSAPETIRLPDMVAVTLEVVKQM